MRPTRCALSVAGAGFTGGGVLIDGRVRQQRIGTMRRHGHPGVLGLDLLLGSGLGRARPGIAFGPVGGAGRAR